MILTITAGKGRGKKKILKRITSYAMPNNKYFIVTAQERVMAGRKRYQKRNKKYKKRPPPQNMQGALPLKVNPADAALKEENENKPQYNPVYCSELTDHCAKGGTIAEFAFSIKATLSDLNDWAENNVQFKRAMELAALGSEAYWWQLARNSMKYKFNTAVWKFVMESLFGLKGGGHSEKPELEAQQQEQYIMIFPEQEDRPESENKT